MLSLPGAAAAPTQPAVWGQEAAEGSVTCGLCWCCGRVCGEGECLLQGRKAFVTFVGRGLGQNKQNHPWLWVETAGQLAGPLLREAAVTQGPWGFGQ